MSERLPRIVVDLEKLKNINCGLGRFSLHFGSGLLQDARGRFEFVFFLPKGAERHLPGHPVDRIEVTPWRKESMRRLFRPCIRPFLPPSRISLWHVTNQTSKYLPLDDRIPVLLTVHDLNFLHAGDQSPRQIRRKLADIQAKTDRAVAIVTDSAFVARDLAAHVDLGKRPVHVVPLGLAAPPPPSCRRPEYLPDGPFLLSVGHAFPHKNFHVLLDLINELSGPRLVIAGKMATPYGGYLRGEVARRGLADRVVLPGEVSDGDRQWLYGHCEAFLFPSLAEGFGFPVLEAMQCGKPVFLSRSTSLPEIAGNHGFFFHSYEAAAMAATYRTGMAAVRRESGFPRRVQAHAATFSWRETVRRYTRIYEAALNG